MSDLSQEKWVAQLSEDDNAVVVDVRTAQERTDGFVANSIHMDIYQPQEFMKSLEGLDKSKNYYIYCRSGNRSGQACAVFNQSGVQNTYNLIGGMMEWNGELVHS
jgi:rhodanese-related sulfurtransferase